MSLGKSFVFTTTISCTGIFCLWYFFLKHYIPQSYQICYASYPNFGNDRKNLYSISNPGPVHPRVWLLLNKKADSQQFGTNQCNDRICTEFLSDEDEQSIVSCDSKSHRKIAPKCHFMNGTNRTPVALVSLPGSGNTWVRGLLEKATGVCTGVCI